MADFSRRGCRFFYVNTTGNDYYPGAATYGVPVTTIAASEAPSLAESVIVGILVVGADAGATTINVGYASGSDAATYPLPDITIAAGQACPFPIPMGGVDGLMMPGLPAAKTSDNDTKFIVFWKPV